MLTIILVILIDIGVIYTSYMSAFKPEKVWEVIVKIYTYKDPDNKYAYAISQGVEEDLTQELGLIKTFGWIALVSGIIFLLLYIFVVVYQLF